MMSQHKEQEGNFQLSEARRIGNVPMSRHQLLSHTLAEQDGWASSEPKDILV
jgi:hypothetical protein